MGIQIIQDGNDFFRIRIIFICQLFHGHRPVLFGPALCHLGLAPSLEWLAKHKDVADTIAFILRIETLNLTRSQRYSKPSFFHHLFAALVHTHNGIIRIIRPLINVQNIFHGTNKLGILLGWNAPFFFQPRLNFIFFNVCRTAS